MDSEQITKNLPFLALRVICLRLSFSVATRLLQLTISDSRLLRKEFSEELSKTYWKPVLWSASYCVISAGGAPLEVIKKYIQNQSRDA